MSKEEAKVTCWSRGCENAVSKDLRCGVCGSTPTEYCGDCDLKDRIHCMTKIKRCNARKLGLVEILMEALKVSQ